MRTHDLLERKSHRRVVANLERPRFLFTRNVDEEARPLNMGLHPDEIVPQSIAGLSGSDYMRTTNIGNAERR